jgi:hypothetical protein
VIAARLGRGLTARCVLEMSWTDFVAKTVTAPSSSVAIFYAFDAMYL